MCPDVTKSVGFVGLGSMGGAMAARLLAAGYDLLIWNRTPARADGLVEAGARRVATPREAATGVDTVLISVADGDALDAVLEGPDGVLAGLGRGVLINTSTVEPEIVRALARRAAASGAGMLDVGVLGNADHAASGELRLYAGGDPDTIERCRQLLEELGKEIVHVGAVGAGMELKLALNLVMGLEMQAMAEAVAFGVARGLPRHAVLGAIASSGFSSPVMRFKSRRMAARSYDAPDFRLRLMAKDLALVADGAERLGLHLPMSTSACEEHERAVGEGLGDLDCAAIVEHLCPVREAPARSPVDRR
jgi:3-hydroxyisobutyrate dehydrogenase